EKRCDSCDTFSSIMETPLTAVGIDYSIKERMQTHQQGGGAKIGVGFAGADISSRREDKTITASKINPNSPSWVAEKLKNLKGVFLIDEADAISTGEDKKKIAELIKTLSDTNSNFKLVVV